MTTTTELSPKILEAARWVEEQLRRHPYADVGFAATVHAGQVKRVAYSLTTKELPHGGRADGNPRGS